MAISTKPPLPWPEATAYGNGIVQAENVDFLNVGRVAELIAYQPSLNASYFRDCLIDGAKLGISNWNCLGIEVSDNEFLDIDEYCLLTESGSFQANNNDFSSGIQDIYIANTLAGLNFTRNCFSSGIIDVNIYGSVSPDAAPASIQIADMAGRVVYQNDKATASYILNTSSWRPGVYSVIILQGQDPVYCTKLVIQ